MMGLYNTVSTIHGRTLRNLHDDTVQFPHHFPPEGVGLGIAHVPDALWLGNDMIVYFPKLIFRVRWRFLDRILADICLGVHFDLEIS